MSISLDVDRISLSPSFDCPLHCVFVYGNCYFSSMEALFEGNFCLYLSFSLSIFELPGYTHLRFSSGLG
jgi:hypothetical protein